MISYSKDFLEELMQQQHRVIYGKITSLNIQELPIETIEGKITTGSVNIDGASAVRRTCSLSMVAENINFSEYLWSLNTKFKLEVGIENNIDLSLPKIIWFPQGIFVITSFSSSLSASGYTINLSGKDKMCLLNGENGGNLPFEVDFGAFQEKDADGNIRIIKYSLKDIIREAIHHYGNEPFYNIIINDLDNMGRELQEYKLDTPLYLIRPENDTLQYFQGTLNGDMKIWIDGQQSQIKNIPQYDVLISSDLESSNEPKSTVFNLSEMEGAANYCAAKISYGQTLGYTVTDMVYAGDLIAKAGETITSVLDKIKNMLGNYEYFYDLDGRFIFQEQKNYLNTAWAPLQTTSEGIEYVVDNDRIQFNFTGNKLITAFNNTPNLSNLKNDYVVWGTRKSSTGKELPVHMRYAIDIKPQAYRSITVRDEELIEYNKKYNLLVTGQNSRLYTTCLDPDISYYDYNRKMLVLQNMEFKDNNLLQLKDSTDYNDNHILTFSDIEIDDIAVVDWREIIYQMALDYRKYGHLDDFALKVAEKNPDLYFSGKTGYEQYYIDLEGFWRDLYNPEIEYVIVTNPQEEDLEKYYTIEENYIKFNTTTEAFNGEKVYKKNADGKYERAVMPYDDNYDYYYKSIIYHKAHNIVDNVIYYQKQSNYYDSFEKRAYWNKKIYEEPETLDFWFDFLDTEGELSKFSVKNIGAREKISNDKDVKSIYYRETPQVILYTSGNNKEVLPGFAGLQVPENYKGLFSQSAQGKSAKDAVDTLLYNHAYCIESVSITTIPIYYLEPNKRIYIYDSKSGIEGEYLVSKITIPLTYNGTSSITAVKAVDRII